MFLAGHIIAMVTYCITKIIPMCSPMIGQFCDTMIVAWGSPSSFLSYKRLKPKLRVFLAGHIVAMVTYCATKLMATCSPMIGQFVDTMMLPSTSIEWL